MHLKGDTVQLFLLILLFFLSWMKENLQRFHSRVPSQNSEETVYQRLRKYLLQ
jgi:Na+-transporting methylmalonyl-CoA/oxaloacetate decarboxylase gamma subunit